MVDWYTFSVQSGKTYRLQWNDALQGDNTKTGKVAVSVYTGSGAVLNSLSAVTHGWTTSKSFSGFNGMVYVKVEGRIAPLIGTYAIQYYDQAAVAPQGGITASIFLSGSFGSEVTVTWDEDEDATGYRVYRSSAENGTYTQIGSDLPTTPQSYMDSGLSYGIYHYRVAAFNGVGEGSQSPAASTMVLGYTMATGLASDTWTPGTVSAANPVVWYSFTATGGTYNIKCDDRYGDGSGTYTYENGGGDIDLTAYEDDGTVLFAAADSNYATPESISGYSGTVYLRVRPFWGMSQYYGNYAIQYCE
jgi:hypothetical protein